MYAASFTFLVANIRCISKLGVGPAILAKNPLNRVIPTSAPNILNPSESIKSLKA